MQRLTGLDAAFLNLETPAAHMHVMAVAVLDPRTAPGPVNAARVRRLVEDRLHLIPPFRRRLVEVPFGLHHPLWVEDPGFDLDFHVRAAALPAPGGTAELADFVGEVASRPLNRSRPLWQLWVVEGLADGRVGIVAKVHHAAIDGASGVEVLAQLVDLEPEAPAAADPVPWQPDRVPGDLELVLGSALSLARQPVRAARAARNLVRAGVRLTRRMRSEPVSSGVPFMTPRLPWNDELTPHRRVAFANVAFDDVLRVKRAFGVTVNDVVLAVVAGALRRHLEAAAALVDRPLVAAVPVSVRAESERSRAGNRVSTLFTQLPAHLDDPAERLRAVAEVTRGAKRVHEDLGPETLAELTEVVAPAVLAGGARLYSQLRLASRVRPAINLIVSNVPGPGFPLYLAGARLERLYPMGPILEGVGLNVTVMSYCGGVDVGFMACRETAGDLDRLAAAVPDALAELGKAADEHGL
jgi:WS/DGAT/MGAT family acyltransferase